MEQKQPKLNTFVIPCIRTDLIARCLETLYKHTPPNFYVIVLDQTKHGIDMSLRDKYENLMIIRTPRTETHPTGNLGFAKATNLGASLVETPYFTMCNDDIEFINEKWWDGVMLTFEKVSEMTSDRPAIIVNPSSLKLPDWSVGRDKGDDFYIIPYKQDYTDEDYDFLVDQPHFINERLTLQPGSVIDGVTLYCSVVDTRKFLEVGPLDEHFFPGSGEDYDYSCKTSMYGYRCVGTTYSYVFHHWSKTFQAMQDAEDVKSLMIPELNWNRTDEKWGPGFDIWGLKCTEYDCNERLFTADGLMATCKNHPNVYHRMPESTIMPL